MITKNMATHHRRATTVIIFSNIMVTKKTKRTSTWSQVTKKLHVLPRGAMC